jgi:hypothetical protein
MMGNRARDFVGYAAISALLFTVALVSWPTNNTTVLDDASTAGPLSVSMDFTKNTQTTATVVLF